MGIWDVLGFFWTIMNKAAMNIAVQIFLWTQHSFPLDTSPGVRLLSPGIGTYLALEKLPVFHTACAIYTPFSGVWEFQLQQSLLRSVFVVLVIYSQSL